MSQCADYLQVFEDDEKLSKRMPNFQSGMFGKQKLITAIKTTRLLNILRWLQLLRVNGEADGEVDATKM